MAARNFRKWQIRPEIPGQGSLLDRLLAGRGWREPKQVSTFLKPNLDQLHDPMLLPDMLQACTILAETLREGQSIAVHGDYDVDGITATALMTRFLRSLGADPKVIIPDRQADGYGLSENAVSSLAASGCSLLITVDCGVTSHDEISCLMQTGTRVIVTDHHECGDCLPAASAVINPRRADSRYPFSGLAGVGVALKLVQALCRFLDRGDLWMAYLDLVALGTVADVVPLIDENRCLVAAGLRQINHARSSLTESRDAGLPASPTIGLSVLLASLSQPDRLVTAQLLGFSAAPRINAAGRMSDAADAVELLLTDDADEASRLALQLADLNRQRQEIENAITREAMEDLDSRQDLDAQRILVVARQEWHSGVIGIVASRLAEHYTRPVIVLAGDGPLYRGSCRSWGEINILAALKEASGTLERFGGHRKAAGLTLAAGQLEAFVDSIERHAAGQITQDQLEQDLIADLVVTGSDLTLDNALLIRQMEPFGEGNPIPLLIGCSFTIGDMRPVGKGRHLKLRLQDSQTGLSWDSIAFGLGDADEWIGPGDRVDVLFSLEVNEWQGLRQAQLNIRDLRPADSGSLFHDQPWEAERLYQSHGSISQLMNQLSLPLQALLPCKQEYKAVYQYLRTHHKQQSSLIELNLLARKIGRSYQMELHPFRLARILAVFQEAGLIHKLDLGHDRMRLSLLPVTQRVRLEDSPTYRRLSDECEGGDPS